MPLRSLASTITTSRGYRPRAANGRFIRPPDELPADRFLEREISWLQLNERVLQLAMDEDIPLLERAKFLAIFSSNLDEFFMIRVAGLKRRIATGIAVRSAAGLEPREVLEKISEVAGQLQRIQADLFLGEVRPALAEQGITIVRWPDLSEEEREPLNDLFTDHIFPVLTPLSVDPAHPFPYISGLSLNLAVTLVNPKTGNEHFARVKVPPSLPRLVRVGGEHHEGAYAVRFVAAGGRHRRQPRPAVHGDGGARAHHVPGHPQRGRRGRGGRRREPPDRHGEGADPPPVRPSGSPRGRGGHRRPRARPAVARAPDQR